MFAICFDKQVYNKEVLDKLSAKEKFETYLEDSEFTYLYGTLKDFEKELNDGCVDTNNNYIYFVNDDDEGNVR